VYRSQRRRRSAGSRQSAYLTNCSSAFRVSHPLGGFLLPRCCRFISPDCRSWGSYPSEHSPDTQPYHLSATDTLLLLGSLPEGARPQLQGFDPRDSPLARRTFP
jgi:hypothetical protein